MYKDNFILLQNEYKNKDARFEYASPYDLDSLYFGACSRPHHGTVIDLRQHETGVSLTHAIFSSKSSHITRNHNFKSTIKIQ